MNSAVLFQSTKSKRYGMAWLLMPLLMLTSHATGQALSPIANYCHEKTKISYRLIDPDNDRKASDVALTVKGKTHRYMTAYSWYGSVTRPPENFKFAILGTQEFDPLLVFDTYLLDSKGKKYVYCE